MKPHLPPRSVATGERATALASPLAELIYRAPRWLPNPHIQTIVPALFARRPAVAYRRERWNTPDGDFIELDWLDQASAQAAASACATQRPLVVLFHGLEGSSDSHYARTLMAAVAARGWHGVVPHFRSCSGPMNLAPRLYHLGDSDEVDWVLRRLRGAHDGPLLVTGVSLGGNALLRWLGERRQDAAIITAGASISAPLDPSVGGIALSNGFNMVYTRNFLKTLKRKAALKLQQHPGLFDLATMMRSRDFLSFDNVVTAPLHGFRDVNDYWHRAGARHVLREIAVPTLVLNARNDPFLPAHALPRQQDVSDAIELDQPLHGGHVGFMTGPFPGRIEWLAQRVLGYFDSFLH
jgi:predicted alpha/beta-fold hydrolase